MPTWTTRRTPARRAASSDVAGALDVDALEGGRVAPVAEVGGRVEGDVGARHPVPQRGDVVEVAATGSAPCPDGLGGGGAPRQRRDGPAVGDEPADERPADEAGTSGDEGVRGRGHAAILCPHPEPRPVLSDDQPTVPRSAFEELARERDYHRTLRQSWYDQWRRDSEGRLLAERDLAAARVALAHARGPARGVDDLP